MTDPTTLDAAREAVGLAAQNPHGHREFESLRTCVLDNGVAWARALLAAHEENLRLRGELEDLRADLTAEKAQSWAMECEHAAEMQEAEAVLARREHPTAEPEE